MNLSLIKEPVFAFGDDSKAKMTTITVFIIANTYGDYIRSGWTNILDCILWLYKLGLLPACVANDVAADSRHFCRIGAWKTCDKFIIIGCSNAFFNIVQSTLMPCALVEKAVFELLRICQRLLPYKDNLADELLRSQMGWHTIINLLSITTRYPDASETGFDALIFIMSQGVHLSPANYILRVDASRQFAESRHRQAERSLHALDQMAGSISRLSRWSHETKGEEAAEKVSRDIGEMWLRDLTKSLYEMKGFICSISCCEVSRLFQSKTDKMEISGRKLDKLKKMKDALIVKLDMCEREKHTAVGKLKLAETELENLKLDLTFTKRKLEVFLHGAKKIDKMLNMSKNGTRKKGLGFDEQNAKSTPQITKFVKATPMPSLPIQSVNNAPHSQTKQPFVFHIFYCEACGRKGHLAPYCRYVPQFRTRKNLHLERGKPQRSYAQSFANSFFS
ncbi:hypothetical protein GIB67_042881 [Kingdonia uniflora]|uniref:CCHC-type domain-containing protein n=1 Tax=Kingdonia uniflora TaxID=39325 RepID=A0A7J7P6A9_9MAGN|nr:hypothetical protein GIB67_042881 [Kingdonia uniflora]